MKTALALGLALCLTPLSALADPAGLGVETQEPSFASDDGDLYQALARVRPADPFADNGAVITGEIDRRVEALQRGLALTGVQRTRIRAVLDDARKQAIRTNAELDVLGIDLRRELDRPMPSEARVARLVDRMTALEAGARKSQVLAWVRIRATLDLRQRTLFDTLHGHQPVEEAIAPELLLTPALGDAAVPASAAQLSIAAERPGAVYIDDVYAGVTPLTNVQVGAGRHRIQYQRHGAPPHIRIINVRPGARVDLRFGH